MEASKSCALHVVSLHRTVCPGGIARHNERPEQTACKVQVASFFASNSGCMVLSKWHILILEGADFVGKGPVHK